MNEGGEKLLLFGSLANYTVFYFSLMFRNKRVFAAEITIKPSNCFLVMSFKNYRYFLVIIGINLYFFKPIKACITNKKPAMC